MVTSRGAAGGAERLPPEERPSPAVQRGPLTAPHGPSGPAQPRRRHLGFVRSSFPPSVPRGRLRADVTSGIWCFPSGIWDSHWEFGVSRQEFGQDALAAGARHGDFDVHLPQIRRGQRAPGQGGPQAAHGQGVPRIPGEPAGSPRPGSHPAGRGAEPRWPRWLPRLLLAGRWPHHGLQ